MFFAIGIVIAVLGSAFVGKYVYDEYLSCGEADKIIELYSLFFDKPIDEIKMFIKKKSKNSIKFIKTYELTDDSTDIVFRWEVKDGGFIELNDIKITTVCPDNCKNIIQHYELEEPEPKPIPSILHGLIGAQPVAPFYDSGNLTAKPMIGVQTAGDNVLKDKTDSHVEFIKRNDIKIDHIMSSEEIRNIIDGYLPYIHIDTKEGILGLPNRIGFEKILQMAEIVKEDKTKYPCMGEDIIALSEDTKFSATIVDGDTDIKIIHNSK